MSDVSPEARPRRRYDASGRRAAAAQRRERILEAASRRFEELGWARTTIADIAREAEVSPELIGQAFGTKPMLLMAAFRRISFGEHRDLQAALDAAHLAKEPDVERRLDLLVTLHRDALVPMSALIPALLRAIDQDPEVLRLVEVARERRRASCRQLATLLGAPDDRIDRTADEIYVLTSGETFVQFTQEVGWTPDEYAVWLRRAISDAVRG